MNARSADGRCDIYALGATLYHLVTGEVPFPGSSHIEIIEKKDRGEYVPASKACPGVPAALDRVLANMLARDPEERYQTASELIVDLERSSLAAAVPSFIDPDLALQDPLVRARLTRPAEPTRPDLEAPAHQPAAEDNQDHWYLRYRNKAGRLCKTRVTKDQIVQRLREGRITAAIEACRQAQGEFQALPQFAEFAEIVASLPKTRKTARPLEPANGAANGAHVEARDTLHEEDVDVSPAQRRLPVWWLSVSLAALVLAAVTYFVTRG
jgi:serine/threonine-protein kinase